jgi:hypothetical protein
MASGQSIAHARLMGAISPKRNRQSAHTDPPEPAAPEGIFFRSTARSKFLRRKPERETRIPGLAQACARPKRGACRRERGASRTPMAGRTRKGSLWRRAVQSAATEFVFAIWFAASRGSTNAGGEDFGYFAPWEKRVRIPPLTSRTVEAASRGPLRRGSRFFRQEAPALTSLTTDIACSPACLCNCRCAAMCIGRRW